MFLCKFLQARSIYGSCSLRQARFFLIKMDPNCKTLMIEAVLDSVACHQDSDGTYVIVKGWAFAEEVNIMTLAVWANETCLGYVPYGSLRSDVSSAFGARCPSPSVGFQGRVRVPDTLVREVSLKLRLVITTSDLMVKELTGLENMIGR